VREGHSLAERQDTWSDGVSLRPVRSPLGTDASGRARPSARAPAVFENETGACDQVLHGLRNEDLGGSRERTDPCPDVDSETSNLPFDRFDLACVQAGPSTYEGITPSCCMKLS
jgi:hypothetical protein